MVRLDAITMKQLRALQAVATYGSFTAAAEFLRQTTPAIHSQIKGLSSAVGANMLQRNAHGGRMQMTAEGQEVLLAAQRIEGILSQTAQHVHALSYGMIGHVTLSVVSTAKYFAPRLVRMLNDSHPKTEISLRFGNRETVIADLDQGRCDLAIMGRPPRAPLVRVMPLGPHPHGVILPPGHPFAGKDGYDPALLMGETFIAREVGSGTRILMQRFLNQLEAGSAPRIIDMESNESIKQAVMAGLGVAFISLHTVYDELRTGRLVMLQGPILPVMRHWYLVAPEFVPPSASTQIIAQDIVDLNGRFLPKP